MRYVARYNSQRRAWFILDRTNNTEGIYSYKSKHAANRRSDVLNARILADKARNKTYGMKHLIDAPDPLAYKD